MPLPIELDLVHWTKVTPGEGKIQKVKCLSFACFYAKEKQGPPEKNSEGTELAANSEVTIEGTTGFWFRGKTASSTEIQLPSYLEVKAPEEIPGEVGPGGITAEKIATGAVTEAKLAAGAVTNVKVAAGTLQGTKAAAATTGAPGATGGEFGTATNLGILRTQWVRYTSKGEANEVISKAKHFLETEKVVALLAVNVKAKAGEFKNAGAIAPVGIKEWEVESTTEVKVTLNTTPASKDEIWILLASA